MIENNKTCEMEMKNKQHWGGNHETEIPRVLGNRSGRDRILVEYTCTFYRGSV